MTGPGYSHHPAAADQVEHQPVVDAFTDVPQADGERPADREVDDDDMFVQGGE